MPGPRRYSRCLKPPLDLPPESLSRDRHDAVLARNKLLLLLTLSSGAVDAICFLGLGKVFTAFMTGNFVFLGLRTGGAPGPHVVSVIAAMCAFARECCWRRYLVPISFREPGRN
jgi:uncharacterized membrane protein YoaK (UPF0700 family)